MTIWSLCDGEAHIRTLSGDLHRLVESQEQVATLAYVDTLEEQALLESMLEDAKPPLPPDTVGFHYLLATPFRYPPLRWGSRFGRVHERGIFFGGLSRQSTLAEAAYYRFVFWYSMRGEPPRSVLRSQHTLFTVRYRCRHGVRLQGAPFTEAQTVISGPETYAETQALGSAMRAAGIDGFEYASARDTRGGLCAGMFSPLALASRQPESSSEWFGELRATAVAFRQQRGREVHRFAVDDFLVAGRLPLPA
ncbi:MAG: RES family NAD+ phosphorylase [Chromatocurvus sp.]